jgi:hypothetical protein
VECRGTFAGRASAARSASKAFANASLDNSSRTKALNWSTILRTTSAFSSDIAHAVSRHGVPLSMQGSSARDTAELALLPRLKPAAAGLRVDGLPRGADPCEANVDRGSRKAALETQSPLATRSFGWLCSAFKTAACHFPGRSSKLSASSSASWNSRRSCSLISESGMPRTFPTGRLRWIELGKIAED